MHQVATIGLQGCRSRVNGQVVDAAHVCVKGKTGPNPVDRDRPDVRRARATLADAGALVDLPR